MPSILNLHQDGFKPKQPDADFSPLACRYAAKSSFPPQGRVFSAYKYSLYLHNSQYKYHPGGLKRGDQVDSV
jgi:hypothetical protein